MDGWDLIGQVRDRLGANVAHYDVAEIVQTIRDRYGDVETLEWIDADTLHAIFSANEI